MFAYKDIPMHSKTTPQNSQKHVQILKATVRPKPWMRTAAKKGPKPLPTSSITQKMPKTVPEGAKPGWRNCTRF